MNESNEKKKKRKYEGKHQPITIIDDDVTKNEQKMYSELREKTSRVAKNE